MIGGGNRANLGKCKKVIGREQVTPNGEMNQNGQTNQETAGPNQPDPLAPDGVDDSVASATAGEVSAVDASIGTVFETRYRLTSLLGSGATGTVYKAIDVLLERTVALKILHSFLLSNQDSVERFKNEALACTILTHPHIAHIYSLGVAKDGRYFMVMDCHEGSNSFAQLIAKHGKIELDLFFDLFLQIIDALKYAHHQGVVHRDLKPSNIAVVEEDGHRKAIILDFGLAKFIYSGAGQQQLTQTAAMLGSSNYMSPEQCRGGIVDERADIYSLACVMVEALTGCKPFSGDSALDVMYKHTNVSIEELGLLKQLPDKIASLITKCLQKDPSQRYQNMQELLIDFAQCSDMRITLKRRFLSQHRKSKANKTLLMIAGLLMAGILLAATIQFMPKVGRTEPEFQQKKLSTVRDYAPLNSTELEYAVKKENESEGLEAGLLILKNWEKKSVNSPDQENKANVYCEFVEQYCKLKNSDLAEVYAKKVFETRYKSLCCKSAVLLARLYCSLNQPERVLSVIKQTRTRFGKLDSECELTLKLYQCKCYLQQRNGKAALKSLAETERLDLPAHRQQWEFVKLGQIEATLIVGHPAEAKALADVFLSELRNLQEPANYAEVVRKIAHLFESGGGDLKTSIGYYEIAKSSYQNIKRPDKVRDICWLLSATYTQLKQYDMAFQNYNELLHNENDWQERASIFVMMSGLATMDKRRSEAIDYSNQALACCSDYLKNNDSDLCSEKAALAFGNALRCKRELLCVQRKYDEAEAFLDEWSRKVSGKFGDCRLLAQIYDSQAELAFLWRQKYKEALVWIDKELVIDSKPEILKSFANGSNANLAHAYLLRTQIFEAAGDDLKSAQEAQRLVVMLNNPCYIRSVALVIEGEALLHLHKTEQAINCLKQAAREFNDTSPSTALVDAAVFNQIADVDLSAQQYKAAEDILRPCINGLKGRYGNKYVELPAFLKKLSQALIAQQKLVESLAPTKEAQSILHEANKDRDELNAAMLLRLCFVSDKLGNAEAANNYIREFFKTFDAKMLAAEICNLSRGTAVAGSDKNRSVLSWGLAELRKQKVADPVAISRVEKALGTMP